MRGLVNLLLVMLLSACCAAAEDNANAAANRIVKVSNQNNQEIRSMQPTKQNDPNAPTGLICELLSHPETTVITTPRPSFGWIVEDPRRGAAQRAYQIIVASNERNISEGKGDVWDSGKVKSVQSIDVQYGGAPLSQNSSFQWAVRVWDRDDIPSGWSNPQKINIGQAEPSQQFYNDNWTDLKTSGGASKVPPNRNPQEVHPIPPSRIVNNGPGHYFIDFGKAAFGTLKLRITCDKPDQEMEVRLGEMRNGEAVETEPGGSIEYRSIKIPLKQGTNTYTLELPRKNVGIRLPEHMNEVMPFRYCEIIGSPSEIKNDDIEQLALFYRFDDNASSFHCSDQVLNDVWEICKYSIKATSFLGVYIDGQRERLPYEADAYINQLGHYCVDREYALARYSHEHLIYHPTWPTEWILHSVLIAWADYMYTGSKDSMIRCYDELKTKTLLSLEREDGLISTRTGLMTRDVMQSVHYKGDALKDVVDWPGGERDGYEFTDVNTVVNAFHYRALVLMSDIAKVLNKSDDAIFYREHAKRVYDSFNTKLFDTKRGIYIDGESTDHASLHANMMAVAMGLVSSARQHSVIEFIKSRGMACSVYGSQYLLEALYSADEDQAALKLMTARDDRSWGHMIYDVGSTITLEAWDRKYKPNLDWNHAWGAAPANIIPRLLVGIEPIEPGFAAMQIKPRIGSLKNVSAKIPTIRGSVNIEITNDNNVYRLRCTIPANTRAEVYLPASDPSLVTEGGKPSNKTEYVKFLRMEKGRAIFAVSSGTFDFTVNKRK